MSPSRRIGLSSGGRTVHIELVETAAGDFLGLGAIRIDGLALRNGSRPIQFRVDTPEGILYTRLVIQAVEPTPTGGVAVQLRAIGTDWGTAEYRDEYNLALLNPAPAVEPVEDRLTLRFEPVGLELGGRWWYGFSYGVRFQSAGRRVHRLWTHATWEIGGSLTGNTLLSQGQCNPPVYRGSASTGFTTYCLKTLDRYGDPQGMSYQLGPRGGLVQAFDFLHTAEAALLMYWPEFGSFHSFLDSPPGCDVLRVIDEYRGVLATDLAVPAKHVLLTRGPLADHEARDLWWAAHEHVYGGIRDRFGVLPSVVKPEAGHEGWATRIVDGRLRFTVAGREVDSTEMLYALADDVLPVLARQGVARFFPQPVHESDVTVLGLRRKLDDGIHGDLHCASVCGSHRFFPSEFWGGIRAWRYLAAQARRLGLEIGAWFAPHFAPRAAIFREHPDWLLTGPETHPWGGGYGFHTIVTADWNTGLYEWVLGDLRRWAEEGGLDYLFTDSWPNLGLLEYNFAAGMRSNFEALGRLYHDVQAIGIGVLSFEGISPFGVSRFGVRDLRGDLLEAQGGVVGQNDFGWWVGEEDMAFGVCLCTEPRRRRPEELERIRFRALANRGYVMSEGPGQEPAEEMVRLHRVYLQALPHMKRRRLLPEGLGVEWRDGRTGVVWAYRDGALSVPPEARVEQLTGREPCPVAHDGRLALRAGRVYRIEG